ncbi:alpha/beta hydrolase [Rhodococcus sp. BP-316]|uniref:alpha/beta hydrolase family protein n=1 Tax=Rhodococcus sp. BP-316 TaxID=2739445 RepID=UPI001C9B8F07|nr:alpha/beta hydrolase [Rhodococcus sp. BP-316]MBY6681497.1 alpha/beta hydrolase [Rhodococcus sp. BP-316]
MFEYFPGNYVWNMSVVGAMNSGGRIDEVDRACRPLLEAAKGGSDAGTGEFLKVWTGLTDSLVESARTAEKAGHDLTAGGIYARATNYLCTAERMLSASHPDRASIYRRVMELAQKGFDLRDHRITRVAIPFEDTTLPGYFSAAPATADGPAPVIMLINGLDSTKEHMYISGFWAELADRGISCLMLDQPGSGEALRLQGLTARRESETWAGWVVDWLTAREDVDTARMGVVGWSLGGYYSPRVAAFEKRFALCVAWGANHNWGAVQRRRLDREGEHPVPHYWDHVLWVWGHDDLDEFIDFADSIHLDGVVEKITVPFLIVHGENDRQIPLEYAHRSYDQAVNAPSRELRIFTAEQGGAEHIGIDDLPRVGTDIADWVSDTFAAVVSQPTG